MLDSVLLTLRTMGWLGIVLAILVIVNTVCGTMVNLSAGESFSWKKMLKGLFKSFVFYISSALAAVAFTILPFINEMITSHFGVVLLSTDLLNTLSSVAVLGIVISTVVYLSKKALNGIVSLANMCAGEKEVITWKVEDE